MNAGLSVLRLTGMFSVTWHEVSCLQPCASLLSQHAVARMVPCDPQRPDAQWAKMFGSCSITKFILKTAFNPLFMHGRNGTEPLKDTGVSRLQSQTATSLRLFPLISTAWPHSRQPCACLHWCWKRSYDPRMHRPSLPRI